MLFKIVILKDTPIQVLKPGGYLSYHQLMRDDSRKNGCWELKRFGIYVKLQFLFFG